MGWPAIGRQHRLIGDALLLGGELRRTVVSVSEGRIADVEVDPPAAHARALRRDPSAVVLRADEVLAPASSTSIATVPVVVRTDTGHLLDIMAATLLRHGVGAFMATLMTAPLPGMLDAAREAGAWLPRGRGEARGGTAALLGVHLEGPALSPIRSAGHDPAALVSPAELARSLIVTDAGGTCGLSPSPRSSMAVSSSWCASRPPASWPRWAIPMGTRTWS
jgi:hypothetical protein